MKCKHQYQTRSLTFFVFERINIIKRNLILNECLQIINSYSKINIYHLKTGLPISPSTRNKHYNTNNIYKITR